MQPSLVRCVLRSLIFMTNLSVCTGISEEKFYEQAEVQRNPNGTQTIRTYSPRPLYQAIEYLQASQGASIDYEDPIYPSTAMHGEAGVNRRLNGGRFEATISKLLSTNATAVQDAIDSLVKQFNHQSNLRFEMYSHPDMVRLDVVPRVAGQKPVLDTTIKLEKKERSVDRTISEILDRVASTNRVCVKRGGLLAGTMNQRSISLGSSANVPARELLAQALDAMDNKSVWLLAYEPSDGCSYLAVFNVRREVAGVSQFLPRLHPSVRRTTTAPVAGVCLALEARLTLHCYLVSFFMVLASFSISSAFFTTPTDRISLFVLSTSFFRSVARASNLSVSAASFFCLRLVGEMTPC